MMTSIKKKNSDNQINDKILKTDDKDEQKEKKLIENLETENKKISLKYQVTHLQKKVIGPQIKKK